MTLMHQYLFELTLNKIKLSYMLALVIMGYIIISEFVFQYVESKDCPAKSRISFKYVGFLQDPVSIQFKS